MTTVRIIYHVLVLEQYLHLDIFHVKKQHEKQATCLNFIEHWCIICLWQV